MSNKIVVAVVFTVVTFISVSIKASTYKGPQQCAPLAEKRFNLARALNDAAAAVVVTSQIYGQVESKEKISKEQIDAKSKLVAAKQDYANKKADYDKSDSDYNQCLKTASK